MNENRELYMDALYIMFYGGVTMMAVVACIYLLFRRANAIVPEVKPPLRLRRWVGAFFALMAVGHVWWLLLSYYNILGDLWMSTAVAVTLDCLTLVPVMLAMQLAMLQDRRRPLWPLAVAMVPVAVILGVVIALRDEGILSWLRVYFLLLGIAFTLYMVYAVRQYGQWLRDNYADLEHKELWQSLIAIFVCLLVMSFYMSGSTVAGFAYIVQINDTVLLALLLWRVETLQTLDAVAAQPVVAAEESHAAPSPSFLSNIGQLLEQHCEATQLYLHHDISLVQLAEAIGTNRSYLSQHFSRNGTTYNAYINGLRIQHFVRLYHEAVAAQRPFTAQQLANECGFHSYSTFSAAFKQRMGQNVTTWMREASD